MQEPLPRLTDAVHPPVVLGAGALTHAAYAGAGQAALAAMIEAASEDPVARAYDLSISHILAFRGAEGLDLLDRTLEQVSLFRIRTGAGGSGTLRVLALMTPGDLMMNTPLDFMTRFLDVRLDLLYLRPGAQMPAVIPDHDVAFVASTESDADVWRRLRRLFNAWPRPILNDPRWLPRLARDALAARLRGAPGIRSATCIEIDRARLDAHAAAGSPPGALLPGGPASILIRPQGSHAGAGLRRIETATELDSYLTFSFARDYYISEFIDTRGADAMFRKYRVAFVDRVPHLCHMAISPHWMVHYLNAGMAEHADRRDAEADAMVRFNSEFAVRHKTAFAALHEFLGFDLYSIDCAETTDGRLVVFEADTAAIIHLMDPRDVFPYKQPQMHRVFAAFERMLRGRVAAYARGGVSDLAM
jgi:hypothetical protein